MSFLQNLQSKSPTAKANYAFAFASIITGLIVIIWMSTIPARFSDMRGNKQAEKKDEGQKGLEAKAEFLDTAKSQLGNLINWNKAATMETPEEVPLEYAPNMANLNLEAGDTVYAEDPTETVPVVQKEKVPQPEPDLEKTPGITMPHNITPRVTPQTVTEKMPETTPQTPTPESGGKKALIEITTTPPKPILIETKTDPQETPQN